MHSFLSQMKSTQNLTKAGFLGAVRVCAYVCVCTLVSIHVCTYVYYQHHQSSSINLIYINISILYINIYVYTFRQGLSLNHLGLSDLTGLAG